jgi:adenylate kinase
VDDSEETIRHRLRVYHDSTRPVLDALEGRVDRVNIDGVGGIDEITARIEAALGA